MKSAGKARNNGLYRHIRTSKEIIRNLLNDYKNTKIAFLKKCHYFSLPKMVIFFENCNFSNISQRNYSIFQIYCCKNNTEIVTLSQKFQKVYFLAAAI